MNLTLDPDEYVERLHRNIKSAWNQGAEHERERIIKLAENRICFDYLEKPEYCDDPACYALADLIVKIKGEQK